MTGRAAGNGSLMHAATSAVYFAGAGRRATMDAARRIAALTHGDRAAWEGTAFLHELIRVALDGADPSAAVPGTLRHVHLDPRARWSTALSPRPASRRRHRVQRRRLAHSRLRAVDAAHHQVVRGVPRAAIDLGCDTDTVAG
jgi:ADP-ribosylglycohydrolase